MDISSEAKSLAEGRIPDQWSVVASMPRTGLSKNELEIIATSIDALVVHLHHQLEELKGRLQDAGFLFALPDHCLRRAASESVQAVESFIAQYGALPLSVETWYYRIASFNFSQHGSQMFDHACGFWFMHRFHEFTMPPIATACSSRWDDMIGWEGDDEELVTDSGNVFFLMEEGGMDEDWKGFELPDESIDPVIDPETGMTFLQWAEFQTKWGGFGALARALREDSCENCNVEVLEAVFQA